VSHFNKKSIVDYSIGLIFKDILSSNFFVLFVKTKPSVAIVLLKFENKHFLTNFTISHNVSNFST